MFCTQRSPKCVDVVIRKISSVDDDSLEQTCAPRMLVWLQLIVMKYLEDPRLEQSRFSCIPQLQLWHIHCLAYVWSVGDLHSLHCFSHRNTAQAVETRQHLDEVDQDNGACVPCSRRLQVLSILYTAFVTIIRLRPCTAPNNALCIIVTTLLRSMLPHLTVTRISEHVLHFPQFALARNHIMRSL
jgi:hypothetical protein